jgi:tRNA-specific 2-thiouridylase
MMRGMKTKTTVFVGLSGGVDSAVAALRLKKQGYAVVGVFIKVWHPEFMVCNWEQERLDAMRVAAHLELPFLTCDAEEAYRDQVARYFIDEYAAGRTPNPDVMCNQQIKFGAFIDFAKTHGADFIATGHYAQRIDTPPPELHRGVDSAKDQTYFLWSLSQAQLNYALFPVGNTPKSAIRREARKASLPVADKHDSQGICFLGHINIPEFLSHYVPLHPGHVLNESGETIGTHQGALVYTYGQRHGFTVTTTDQARTPLYVIEKDTATNTITVATQPPMMQPKDTVVLRNVVLRSAVHAGDNLLAQFRYRQTPIPIKVVAISPTSITIKLSTTTAKASPGQSCVMYRDSLCIGGGVVA